MWISEKVYDQLVSMISQTQDKAIEAQRRDGMQNVRILALEAELERAKAERTWFMHRLNQVEHERGMLMQDRLGIKVSVPTFMPAMDNPSEALQQAVDISTVGMDAHPETDADRDMNPGIDYTSMPGYKGTR